MKFRIIKDNGGWSGGRARYRVQRKIFGIWFYYWDYVPNDAAEMMQHVHRRFETEASAEIFISQKIAVKQKASIIKEITLPLILIAFFFLGACSPRHCPTYSDANYIPSKWDTVPATYADVEEYLRADTVPQKLTLMEKTGALLGLILIGTAISKNHD